MVTQYKRRVRDNVEWSGVVSSKPYAKKRRNESESATRHAMPRSDSIPSKYPISNARKYTPGLILGLPRGPP